MTVFTNDSYYKFQNIKKYELHKIYAEVFSEHYLPLFY